jgi:hypothetical protein
VGVVAGSLAGAAGTICLDAVQYLKYRCTGGRSTPLELPLRDLYAGAPFRNKRRSTMPAMLKLTHKAIGAEVRRGAYDVVVDGERAGSVEMNHTIEIPVEPGRHTLLVRNGRNSSSTQTFDAAEGEVVAFRCTGKRFLPIFLASFVMPRLALKLVRD